MRENHDLIGDIHDAALDIALWSHVLRRIVDFVGGQACGLVSKDMASKSGDLRFYYNVDPHYIQTYSEIYAKFSPIVKLPQIGEFAGIRELMSYDDYRQSRFYQEWVQPQGWPDIVNISLESSPPNSGVALSLIPHNRMVDDEMRRRIAFIAPHVRRAWLISKAIELRQTEAATFADALDGLSAGMLLVNARGMVVHANAAGQDMLYTGDFLRSAGGKLATRNPLTDQTLQKVFAAAASGDDAVGSKAIAVPLAAQGGERYVAHVLPLTSGARHSTGVAHTAVAAVFVRKAELGSPLDVVAQTYRLTPTELRVLHAIVEIGGVPETAEALGVAETTVKTHLYRLFDKTDVSRQADLVKLVAGFTNPLVDR